MSAPNSITVVNNSGQTIDAAVILHASDEFVIPSSPFEFSIVLQVGSIANGATSAAGSASVSDGLADWWVGGISIAGQTYLIVSAVDLPFKKCDSPDDGATSFTISPETSSDAGFPVTIGTFNSDGSSDGTCAAQAMTESQLEDSAIGLLGSILQEIANSIQDSEEGDGDSDVVISKGGISKGGVPKIDLSKKRLKKTGIKKI